MALFRYEFHLHILSQLVDTCRVLRWKAERVHISLYEEGRCKLIAGIKGYM